MAYRSYNNSISANRSFGLFNQSTDAGEYIYNKKSRATFCVANKCAPSVKVGTESNRLLFNRSNKINMYPCENIVNSYDLYTGLITKLDLKGVIPLVYVSPSDGSKIYPATFSSSGNNTNQRYIIDPSGNLFGNTICGINNYLNYRVYNPMTNPTYITNKSNITRFLTTL
jgi:hypothetical protein